MEALYCAPGNGGIAEVADCVAISEGDFGALVAFAQAQAIDVTVVGPEKPLLEGIVDTFEAAGLSIFGPNRNAALLEGSKAFAKELMKKYRIPTARYESFDSFDAALDHVRRQGAPIVVKADGLAAGKGVVVARELSEAERALESIMRDRAFGEAGRRVVVEEYLSGQELTLLAFVDGEVVRPMVPSQDHKPVFDGDRGPNTGGMGAYSPVPQFSERDIAHAVEAIVKPTAAAMVQEGRPFRGSLYCGLMLTEHGPKVVEFNVRLGDPEAQAALPRLKSDLAEIVMAGATGRLAEADIEWSDEAAVCVVMAAPGYPGSYETGQPITGLHAASSGGAVVFHAGTKTRDGQIVTSGGRVLGVTGFGRDIRSAREHAYQSVERIHFEGAHYRTDIGLRALL